MQGYFVLVVTDSECSYCPLCSLPDPLYTFYVFWGVSAFPNGTAFGDYTFREA